MQHIPVKAEEDKEVDDSEYLDCSRQRRSCAPSPEPFQACSRRAKSPCLPSAGDAKLMNKTGRVFERDHRYEVEFLLN